MGLPTTPSFKLKKRLAMARRSIIELKQQGSEIYAQFTGDDYKQVLEDQKQLLLETLVSISSDQLEKTMRRRLFRNRAAPNTKTLTASIRKYGSKENHLQSKAEVSEMMTAVVSAMKPKGASAQNNVQGTSISVSGARVAPDC